MEALEDFETFFEENYSIIEQKRQHLVSKLLKQGGVLGNGHIHFEEEYSNGEETSSSQKKKKRKQKEAWEQEEEAKGDNFIKISNKKEIPFLRAYKKCRRQKNAFPYGNESGYYDKRIGFKGVDDPRLRLFEAQWFENKDVLDVGCHEGYIAITLAQMYHVASMQGVDIDDELIKKAYKNLKQETTSSSNTLSLGACESEQDKSDDVNDDKFYDALSDFDVDPNYDLLKRVSFRTRDFLKYKINDCSVDTILCLSVTKWIHLNWGDKGLLSLFHKIFHVLRPGGVLILEPQAWKSYRKNRHTTTKIHENYLKLTLRPNNFTNILIDEVGFNSCKLIARTIHDTEEGFDRPIYLYTK